MRKQLQGIGLVLFGILLCVAEINFRSKSYTFFGSGFTLFPFSFVGAGIGVAGLVLLFGEEE